MRSRNVFLVSTRRDLILASENKIAPKQELKTIESERDFDTIRLFENYNPRSNFTALINRYYWWIVAKGKNPPIVASWC